MKFRDYQEKAVETFLLDPKDKLGKLYLFLGLVNEAGEVAGKVKKWLREDYDENALRSKLLGELGDVLWYVAVAAYVFNLDLDDIAAHNLEKLARRKEQGKLRGDGDDR